MSTTTTTLRSCKKTHTAVFWEAFFPFVKPIALLWAHEGAFSTSHFTYLRSQWVCEFRVNVVLKRNSSTTQALVPRFLREHRLFQVHKATTIPEDQVRRYLKSSFSSAPSRVKRTFNIYCLDSREILFVFFTWILNGAALLTYMKVISIKD